MNGEDLIHFEEVVTGTTITGPYRVPEDEMVAFARHWDPLPVHVDKKAAAASSFGGLIAPGTYLLAVIVSLIHALPRGFAVIASPGYDEVRFMNPVRPGDDLTLEAEVLDKRLSESKPDRGVVRMRFTLRNQSGVAVVTMQNVMLVSRRELG
jgi:acyl dehydratase